MMYRKVANAGTRDVVEHQYPVRQFELWCGVRRAASAPSTTHAHARIIAAIERMTKEYGGQGWWPVRCERKHFTRPRGQLERDGYHPKQFDFPRTRKGRWEICCGAVLTQNTAWTNVRQALANLEQAGLSTPGRLVAHSLTELRRLIRPAGYFNQKSGYVRAVAEWFLVNDRKLAHGERSRSRLELARAALLGVRGVGPETADSILLYAYSLPTFVVDTYTRRVFGRLAIVEAKASYESIRALLEEALIQPTVHQTVRAWQEAHALIVAHAKRHHGRGANAALDFLTFHR